MQQPLMTMNELAGKKLAIWGYGREGQAALSALRLNLPRQPITVFCSRQEAGRIESLGDDMLTAECEPPTPDLLANFEVVIKSPGISPYQTPAREAAAAGVRFISGTGLWFAEHVDYNTIGVTGSKGKSTTSALIAHLLRSQGHRTSLAGNIGVPLLDLLGLEPADYWVSELSSYQTADAAPKVAVVTNLFPEHLDWHGSVDRYYFDKLALIRQPAAEAVVLNAASKELASIGRSMQQRLARFDSGTKVHWFAHVDGWHVDGDHICFGKQKIMHRGKLPLPGYHNAINLCAALAAVDAAGLPAREMIDSVVHFVALPHRMTSLGMLDGIEYVDDSISTTPQATLAAISHYALQPTVVLVGGFDRGLDWSLFASAMQKNPVKAVLTMGENGAKIADKLRGLVANQTIALHECTDLLDAVPLAQGLLQGRGVVLMSPGAPSFPRYQNYIERGRHFAQLAGFPQDNQALQGIVGLGIA